jgi:riboflavin transporter FmnP
MNTKTLAVVVMFAALATVLSLSPLKIGFPIPPFNTFLYYQIWEIPIVVAFLIYGTTVLILVTAINTGVLLVFFPGGLPSGPIYNAAAILCMILGMGIVKFFITRHSPKRDALVVALYTLFGVSFRTVGMSFVNYSVLGLPYPFGYSLPYAVVIGWLPFIAVFNATLALYTIPVSYGLARIVKSNVGTIR